MFEFAISQHRRHKPSSRLVGSALLSCFAHFTLLFVILEYPQLFDTGVSRWFSIRFSASPIEDKNWRPVAMVTPSSEKMILPSAGTLRSVMYDWNKEKAASNQAPVRLRWGAQQLQALADLEEAARPAKQVLGTKDPEPQPPPAAPGAETTPGTGADKSGTAFLPAPQPEPTSKPEPEKLAEVPRAIPPLVKPAPEKSPSPAEKTAAATKTAQAQVFKDQQSAIRAEGSGLFDTRGFPMGDYATMIIERVKSNWAIPSNLRSSQGRTTIIFYIGRDGRSTDARIVNPSGNSSLDIAALSAVIGSNPFPPLPDGFPADRVGAKFVFSYNERP